MATGPAVETNDTVHLHLVDALPRAAHRQGALVPQVLQQLPLGSVRPAGWIRHQLDLMTEGMTGRLDEISSYLKDDNGWFVDGSEGWEEQPYWLRGYYAMAVLTESDAHLEKAQYWVERVIGSAKEDGWFGSSYHRYRKGTGGRVMADLWGHMVMCHALQLHYDYTGDDRVPAMLTKFFRLCAEMPDDEFIPRVAGPAWQVYREDFGDWKVGVQMKRAGEMLPSIYWLHRLTGDDFLLPLAVRFHNAILPPVSEFLDVHGVNWAQRYGYPALFGQQAGVDAGVAESEYWYAQHMAVWGQQPRGAYGADEMIRSGKTDPSQGMETCAMVELALKFYEIGRITGSLVYADRVEDLLLNHFPAAQTPDLKALHYLTASNLPQLDRGNGHDFWNEVYFKEERNEFYPMLSYSPHRYRCCQHNVAMGWPFYAMNLWQRSADNGLVAWMYGASEVTVDMDGTPVRLVQETDYPFNEKIRISVAEGSGTFPLYLRVPGWCKTMSVTVDGSRNDMTSGGRGFIRIAREWKPGDAVELVFDTKISCTRWPRTGAVTVDRGPLSYSVKIDEEWKTCGGTDAWPEWEVLPTSDWNYGLVLDADNMPCADVTKKTAADAGQPWTVDNAPIELTVKAKKIPAWKLEEGGSPQDLRRSPVRTDADTEEITMIPMGCARLRMSCLPVVGDTPEAEEWKPYRDC